MKVLLTGMFDYQLEDVAAELRAEFPEVDVEVVDSRAPAGKLVPRAESADLVVCGRFLDHTRALQLRTVTRNVRFLGGGGARGVGSYAREWIAKRREACSRR